MGKLRFRTTIFNAKFGIRNSELWGSFASEQQYLIRNSECGIRNWKWGFVMDNRVVQNKSKQFALKVVSFYRFLTETKKEYVLSKQLLRSGTSIGANIREAQRAQSLPDFYSKMNIALKEAEESLYWLELLEESGIAEKETVFPLYNDCEEIVRILVSITKNQKNNY